MTKRNNHYEVAFEDYLRSRTLAYVAVDEARKALHGRVALKNFDFVVYSESSVNLLVDVKGRKFPDTLPGRREHLRAWENWITLDDADSLSQWADVFGRDFSPLLVFAYWIQGPPQRCPFDELHWFRGRWYAFMAVDLEAYLAEAHTRSERWGTLSVSPHTFCSLAQDVADFL
ncbi:MAG: HYExAFE family protein [Phycisphaerales bacterium]|jgi:hypothetical protein|nr:HYExAFE family protein [Phycisphaerales bacterium]